MTRASFIKSAICSSLVIGSPFVGDAAIDKAALIKKWRPFLAYQSTPLPASVYQEPMFHSAIPEHLWSKVANELEATERRMCKLLKKSNKADFRRICDQIVRVRRKYDPHQQFFVANCTHEQSIVQDITSVSGLCMICEIEKIDCRHPQESRVAGPRINVMWGSRETVVCEKCGKWKISVDHDEWRTDSMHQAIQQAKLDNDY